MLPILQDWHRDATDALLAFYWSLRRARLISGLPPGHGQRYHTNRIRTRR